MVRCFLYKVNLLAHTLSIQRLNALFIDEQMYENVPKIINGRKNNKFCYPEIQEKLIPLPFEALEADINYSGSYILFINGIVIITLHPKTLISTAANLVNITTDPNTFLF